MANDTNNDIRDTALPDYLGDWRGSLVNQPGIVPPLLPQLRSLHIMYDVRLSAIKYLCPLSPPDLLVPSVSAVTLLVGREMLEIIESGSWG